MTNDGLEPGAAGRPIERMYDRGVDVVWARINAEVAAEFGPLEEPQPTGWPEHPWRRGVVRLVRGDARRVGRELRQAG